MVTDPLADQLAREQNYVTKLYNRLDELRELSRQRLDRVRREGPSGSPQNRSERDAFATLHAERLAQLDSVEDRLCFGRLDLADNHVSQYVGRLGLTDLAQTPLLIDWRAPAAVPFYQATAAHRLGVSRRRHITTRSRTVVAIEDEVFDLETMPDVAATLSGEGALLAALATERTGRMGDIVATIQGEQDRIIRADLTGPLVVQGGPGTGKTAVALHRAAYLLYTHRDRLANSGILMVGPSRAFLTYIDQVLPSLGETGVVCVTIGSLIPGFTATSQDTPAVAALKGRSVMAKVVRRAVRNRQRLPVADQTITLAGHQIELRRADLAAAQAVARASHRPYNQARAIFVNDMIGRLTAQLIEALGGRELAADFGEVARDVRSSRAVRIALNLCWLPLTPQGLVAELYAKPHLLKAAAPELTAAELALLTRPVGSPWTVADVPIVDEAAELLGQDDEAERRQQRSAAAARERELDYARGVLASHGNVMVSAEQLADRWTASGPRLTPAERAALDRTWTYGHVVVDEAQELSAMDWRALLRRCPSRSMTIVGDVGQTHAAAGAKSWSRALDPIFGRGRWQQVQLTINYRTPASIMAPAEERARAAGVPVTVTVAARDLPDAFATLAGGPALVAAGLAETERLVYPRRSGRTAIIAAAKAIEAVRHAVENSPLAELASGPSLLDSPLAVLTPVEAKGLEFDDVVLIDPAAVAAGGPSGPRDLYVAMTRPTRRLRLVVP